MATRSLSRRWITSPLSKTRGRVPSFCILYLKLGVRPFGWFSRSATRNAGVGRPVTGHRLAPSPSIRSATSWFGRQPHKSSFPDRSASLLSRADLATPKPRRATQEMGGAEPPGATRRAPGRTRRISIVAMARKLLIRPVALCGDRGCAGRRRAQRQPDSRDLIYPNYG